MPSVRLARGISIDRMRGVQIIDVARRLNLEFKVYEITIAAIHFLLRRGSCDGILVDLAGCFCGLTGLVQVSTIHLVEGDNIG
jgi:hypothetical protein